LISDIDIRERGVMFIELHTKNHRNEVIPILFVLDRLKIQPDPNDQDKCLVFDGLNAVTVVEESYADIRDKILRNYSII